MQSPLAWLIEFCPGSAKSLSCGDETVFLSEASRAWTHPSSRVGVGVGVCMRTGWEGKDNLTLRYIKRCQAEPPHQTSRSSSALFSITVTTTAAMALLLAVFGALLCSLAVSSEVVPKPDFNLQAVRHKATNNLIWGTILIYGSCMIFLILLITAVAWAFGVKI